MADNERPVALPFVRSPSDRAHDAIKGPYTAEDAIRPGTAIGEGTEFSEGLTGDADRDLTAQSREEALEAEHNRREDFSEVEKDEAEARDALARDIAKDENEGTDEDHPKVPTRSIPAVGSMGGPDANAGPGTVNAVAQGSEEAFVVSQAKQGDSDAAPVLEGDPDSDKSREEEVQEVVDEHDITVPDVPEYEGDPEPHGEDYDLDDVSYEEAVSGDTEDEADDADSTPEDTEEE